MSVKAADDTDDCVVRTSQLTKYFGDGKARRAALDSVDLEVRRGDFVCILGPSGCGKSTLLGVIGGLDRSYQGSVELFGDDITKLSDRSLAALRAKRIGFVFQAFHLLPHLTVLDNVMAPALFTTDSSLTDKRGLELLERLGLGDRARDWPAQLSGGQRQRVAIARALLAEPDLLLCDEPTGNLDIDTGQRAIDLFSELHADSGITIVAVTHETRLAAVASRTLHLEHGSIVDAPVSKKSNVQAEARS